MNNSDYVVRNYKSEDFNEYCTLVSEAEKQEPKGYPVTPAAIAERLYQPEKTLFLAVSGGLVGFMNLWPEPDIGRGILNCWIRPEHRRKGLASALFEYFAGRAYILGIRIAHVNVSEDNTVAARVLSGLGFVPARRYLELRLDMREACLPENEHNSLQCRHLRPGEEDKLTHIQNRAFTDTWGYNPNTVESTRYCLNMSHRSPEDVVLVCEGDSIVGYCWTEIVGGADTDIAERKGRVFMLGVDPDYHGQGAGRLVLLSGLHYLKDKGVPVVELTVDSENQIARELYNSMGFEVREASLWYEKVLEPENPG